MPDDYINYLLSGGDEDDDEEDRRGSGPGCLSVFVIIAIIIWFLSR